MGMREKYDPLLRVHHTEDCQRNLFHGWQESPLLPKYLLSQIIWQCLFFFIQQKQHSCMVTNPVRNLLTHNEKKEEEKKETYGSTYICIYTFQKQIIHIPHCMISFCLKPTPSSYEEANIKYYISDTTNECF